ncbi:MAG: DUF4846 domain-containing protein [Flavobacteriales bacterium]|jgi:hypothetical protein|nr:DUF4846 domain-containing protein [Flavobacteriales bacterium]
MKLFFSFLTILFFANCNTETPSKESTLNHSSHIIDQSHPVKILTNDTLKYSLSWLEDFDLNNTLINRIQPPEGFQRVSSPQNSFTHWIRRLPLKQGNPNVMLYNGEEKWNQDAHFAVFDLDIGTRDLQQCADATMRIRAEYLYHTQQYDKIHFNYTNGAYVPYQKWRNGYYPIPKGKSVSWVKKEKCNTSYKSFKSYLIQVFNYAGTHSLSKELTPVPYQDMQVGDLLIQGGFPGHAVMVVDLVESPNGTKMYLLAQSYMPAQNFQLLKSLSTNSPWYPLDPNPSTINTPEWTFESSQLMRWN